MENIYFEEPEYPFFDKLKKCVSLYVNLSLALYITFFLIRVLELCYIIYSTQMPKEFSNVVLMAFVYDLVFFLKYLPAGLLVFLVVFFVARNKMASFWAYGIYGTCLVILYMLLIKYFTSALIPLGSDIFSYSFKEIGSTISSTAKFDIIYIIIFILPFPVFWVLAKRFYTLPYLEPFYAIGTIVVGFILIFMDVDVLPKSTSFKNDFSYNVALNKEAFFVSKGNTYFFDSEPEVDIYAGNYIEDETLNTNPGFKRFNYTDDEYPFLHIDQSADVLGSFFRIDTAHAANIVIIEVEGLGRAYSGPNAYLGSFTPFLDALAQKGLYWPNFLSAQGRSFASLPSISGSLPYGETGFLDFDSPAQKSLTLFNILKGNGYSSRFYCGFDVTAENQGRFLTAQGVSVIADREKLKPVFPANFLADGSYADREVFKYTIQSDGANQQQPYITYVQTHTMSSPYAVPDQQKQLYKGKFEQQMSALGFTEPIKGEHRKYADIYSSVLYTDAALQAFFLEYAKLPSYKNTIFIITGNHRLADIPMSTKIDRNHVPLIIYSPMLKRSASFKSVSSHFDIAPSLLALMKNSYRLRAPGESAWMGSGLDTVNTLRNIHKFPIKQIRSELSTFVSGLYFLDADVLYSITDNMAIAPFNDDGKTNELRAEFNQFKSVNERFAREKKLIPDNLYNAFK